MTAPVVGGRGAGNEETRSITTLSKNFPEMPLLLPELNPFTLQVGKEVKKSGISSHIFSSQVLCVRICLSHFISDTYCTDASVENETDQILLLLT